MNLNIIEIIRQGGILMWPIMFTSVVGMAIVIERWLTLRRADIDTREFMDTMRQVIRQNRIQEAINICDETDAPVARIIKAGLLKHRQSREIIREAIEDAGRFEIPRLERYLSGLATCATIAPMLGLLGTVQGMILAFAQIQNKRGQVNPSDLAEGIGNALVTTAAGLAVAIPLLILYNYFTSRVENMLVEMEASSVELVDMLTRHRGDTKI
ncbi:MAG TPA: MotA/TolQ/ExbB proton channel family protein [Candidatus Hydrogenedentes bacterium]|nr:MotA/TolQ/ExbB proton channel family protein [Candidatus Hydrogenedentota bacterium]